MARLHQQQRESSPPIPSAPVQCLNKHDLIDGKCKWFDIVSYKVEFVYAVPSSGMECYGIVLLLFEKTDLSANVEVCERWSQFSNIRLLFLSLGNYLISLCITFLHYKVEVKIAPCSEWRESAHKGISSVSGP